MFNPKLCGILFAKCFNKKNSSKFDLIENYVKKQSNIEYIIMQLAEMRKLRSVLLTIEEMKLLRYIPNIKDPKSMDKSIHQLIELDYFRDEDDLYDTNELRFKLQNERLTDIQQKILNFI